MFFIAVKHEIKRILPRSIYQTLSELKDLGSPKIPGHELYISHVEKKHGIEIGGPSRLFKTTLPLYQEIESLDGVNFSTSTVWEGSIKSGQTYNFIRDKKGKQYISDGTNLSQINDCYYDFVLSSNCLEHIANPLRALLEWKRILKCGGSLILVIPNKKSNFDHKRPTTSFEHILEDFNKSTAEDDLTHLDEILELHDLSMDPAAGNYDSFKVRSLDNFNNRTLHHHVFNLNLIGAIFAFLQMDIIHEIETEKDLFVLAIKN